MNKKIILLLIIIMLSIGFSFILYTNDDTEIITIQLRWDNQFQFAGYYAADWEGYYAEEGINIEIVSAVDSDGTIHSSISEVLEGSAQFGIGAADVIIENDKPESELVIITSIFQESAAAFYTKEEIDVEQVKDISNLKVARRLNDLIDIELQAMLLTEGIDPNKITAYDHNTGLNHLISGTVDIIPGYSISAPYDAEQIGFIVKEIRPIDFGVNFYGDSLFTTQEILDEHPDLVKKIRRATLKGWEYAIENSTEISKKITEEFSPFTAKNDYYKFNLFQASKIKSLMVYPLIEVGNTNTHRWYDMHNFLLEMGLVNNAFDENFIYDELYLYQNTMEKTRFIVLISVVIVVLIFIGIYAWTIILKKMVKSKTHELMLSNLRNEGLIKNISDVIILYDEKGIITYVSPNITTLYGWKESEVVGHDYLYLVLKEDYDIAQTTFADILKSANKSTKTELRIINRSGEIKNISLYISNQLENESINGMLVHFQDVSYRKDYENKLKTSMERAEHANEVKSKFLSNMSHEIRTPLNGLMGMLQLSNLMSKDDEQKEYLEIAYKSSKILLDILNDILDYTKLEAKKLMISYDYVNVFEVCDDIYELYKYNIGNKNLEFVYKIQDGMPKIVRLDQMRIRQIISNLIGNAMKFTNEGTIKFEVNYTVLTTDQIEITFLISDTGIGIKEEHQEKMYERFTQIDYLSHGTGLGLAISSKLALMMNSQLECKSIYNEGSQFWFTLVTSYQTERRTEVSINNRQSMLKSNKSILVVDDDKTNLIFMQKYLEKLNYHVIVCDDPYKAIEYCKGNYFNLILMDINLPGIDGVEATRILKTSELSKVKNTAIVAVTAYALAGDKEKYLKLGMDDYLTKPFEFEDLNFILKKWLL